MTDDTLTLSASEHEAYHAPIYYDPTYRFEVLQEKHVASVLRIFTRAFCDDEPMTHYLAMRDEAFLPFARRVVHKAVADQLSIVAVKDEEVVAFALSEDIMQPLSLDFPVDEKFHPIFSVLEQLGTPFFPHKTFPLQHIVHLFITAVAKSYRGQGLSRQVNFKAMELAHARGFAFMYCEFTNYLNEKGTMKYLNYDKLLVGTCIYNEFTLAGSKPFSRLKGFANSYLWELRKDYPLTFQQDGHAHAYPLRFITLNYP